MTGLMVADSAGATHVALAPLSAAELRTRLAVIQSVMRDVMQEGADFGVIPGTDKPTLYKPGAEKLCVTFRLAAGDPLIEPVQEVTGDIRYRVRVPIIAPDGTVLAVGVGECSTGEEKYRWRRPVHEYEFDAALETDRRVKWTRKGETWPQVRVHPADVANTVLKMAHKRAYVHGVIMATAAGAIFTQDIEDLPDGVAEREHTTDETSKSSSNPPAPQRKAPPSTASGEQATIRIKQITQKQGHGDNGPWTKFTIEAQDGTRYGTFDVELATAAKNAGANEVRVTFREGKYGRDLIALLVVDREPGDEA